jgi:5-methyltetrahydropteroyltriglutamate--homocysteine methyltransferase
MRTSSERILTTHVGSLPRKQVVVDVLFAQDRDEPTPSFDQVIDAAVLEIVGRQKTAGVDLPSDGEMSKISYATYIRHRLTGFAILNKPPPPKTSTISANFVTRSPPEGAHPNTSVRSASHRSPSKTSVRLSTTFGVSNTRSKCTAMSRDS